jgi:filamentous hemagglutinin family protein
MTSHLDPGPRRSGLTRLLTLGSLLWLGGLLTVSQAQITLDGSLGPGGPLTGPDYRIGADVGQIRGGNLFHSFGEFNVPRGGSATFAGPNTIANIVGRVTGGQPSTIDGVLRSEIAGANLFLLNPSGVLFGPNARLEVRGSFHVSTADFLRFADGATFAAHLGHESVLTVAPPTAFGFLGPHPAAITIQGSTLHLPEGKAMSVVGGDLAILGNAARPLFRLPTLGASGGRIQLASVASPGEAVFNPLELAPDLQVHSFARLGRLTLAQGAFLDTYGNGGGSVLLRGDHLLLDTAFVSAYNAGQADSPGLGIDIQGRGDVTLNGAFLVTGSDRTSRGSVGEIRVQGGAVTLTGGSIVGVLAEGVGTRGDVTVSATQSILISGPDTGIVAVAAGDPGQISLAAPRVTIDGGAVGAPSIAPGLRAGDIAVEAGQFSLLGGGLLVTGTSTEQHGGEITLNASESISIAGSQQVGTDVVRSSIISATTGRGNAGRIALSTPRLTMDAGLIVASTFGDGNAGDIDVRVGRLSLSGGAQIDSSTRGTGRGGDMTVVATEEISIAGHEREDMRVRSGLFSTANGSGHAGRLFVSAPLLLLDGGRIIASTLGDGNAGNIEVQARRLTLLDGAQIFSGIGTAEDDVVRGTGGPGRGGNITVIATDALSIAGRDGQGFRSSIGSNALVGSGDAGNIFIATPHLDMRDSFISTAIFRESRGNAGDLRLEVGRLSLADGARISSSTDGPGQGGRWTSLRRMPS